MPKRDTDLTLTEITSDPSPAQPASTDAVLVSDPTPAPRRTDSGESPLSPSAHPGAADPGSARRPIPTVRHLPSRPPVSAPEQPEREYAYSPLLTRVTVYPWPQRYNYYQRFSVDAERFSRVRGKETPAVPYFSYIPQYSQLGREQLQFYLWFREQCRARVPMDDVDFPYILLYIYEIINLPSIPPEEGADTMAWLWLTYRRRYAELDKYLSEWMCDYCLVHAIACPASLAAILPDIVRRASLKEFYLAPMDETDGVLPPLSAESLIALASDYSFRAGKYYQKNAAEYDTHIPAAVAHAAEVCGLLPEARTMRLARAERDAFCGSLCAQLVKRRVRVEYRSFARSQELRERVTQAVKLAENQLRARLKIRPRLGTEGADPAIAAAVEEYFVGKLPMTRQRSAASERAYEHLYEAPEEGMDLALSRRIEAESWENTALLSPEFAEAAADAALPGPLPDAASDGQTAGDGLTAADRDLLSEVLAGGSVRAWCRRQTKRTDPAAAAARLNDYAMDTLGDVILEEDGADWRLIEDYREDVQSWITA